MKVKRWRQKAVNREERESVIKEAKAVRGPYGKVVSSSSSNSGNGDGGTVKLV